MFTQKSIILQAPAHLQAPSSRPAHLQAPSSRPAHLQAPEAPPNYYHQECIHRMIVQVTVYSLTQEIRRILFTEGGVHL